MTLTRTLAATGTALGLTLASLAGVAPALAQDTAAPAEAGDAYSEETLTAFVMAALDVAELRQTYQSRLEAAADAQEQQAIVDEANSEILEIVEASDGITVEEYIEIGQNAAADPDLNARIVALMQEEVPAPQ